MDVNDLKIALHWRILQHSDGVHHCRKKTITPICLGCVTFLPPRPLYVGQYPSNPTTGYNSVCLPHSTAAICGLGRPPLQSSRADEDDQRVVAVVGFEYKKDNTFLVIDTLFVKKNSVSKGGTTTILY